MNDFGVNDVAGEPSAVQRGQRETFVVGSPTVVDGGAVGVPEAQRPVVAPDRVAKLNSSKDLQNYESVSLKQALGARGQIIKNDFIDKANSLSLTGQRVSRSLDRFKLKFAGKDSKDIDETLERSYPLLSKNRKEVHSNLVQDGRKMLSASGIGGEDRKEMDAAMDRLANEPKNVAKKLKYSDEQADPALQNSIKEMNKAQDQYNKNPTKENADAVQKKVSTAQIIKLLISMLFSKTPERGVEDYNKQADTPPGARFDINQPGNKEVAISMHSGVLSAAKNGVAFEDFTRQQGQAAGIMMAHMQKQHLENQAALKAILDAINNSNKLPAIDSKLNEKEAEIQKLKEEMQKLKDDNSVLKESSKEREAAEKGMAALQQDMAEKHKEAEALKAQLAEAIKEKEAAQSRGTELDSKIADMTKEKEDLTKELDGKKTELAGLNKEKNELADSVKGLEGQLKEKSEQIGNTDQEKQQIQQEVEKLKAEKAEAEKKLSDVSDKAGSLESQVADKDNKLKEMSNSLNQSQVEKDALQKESENLKKDLSAKDAMVSEYEKTNADLTKKLGAHQEEAELHKKNAQSATSEAEAAKLANKNLERENSNLANRVGKLEGMKGDRNTLHEVQAEKDKSWQEIDAAIDKKGGGVAEQHREAVNYMKTNGVSVAGLQHGKHKDAVLSDGKTKVSAMGQQLAAGPYGKQLGRIAQLQNLETDLQKGAKSLGVGSADAKGADKIKPNKSMGSGGVFGGQGTVSDKNDAIKSATSNLKTPVSMTDVKSGPVSAKPTANKSTSRAASRG